jgi:hypothetical protein
MDTAVLYGASLVVFMHGLIHLMGFATYWQLAEINELPYKTSLLSGGWEVGEKGIRLFGLLWLMVTVGYAIAAYGLVTEQSWWEVALAGVTVFSLVLTVLDYDVAYAGVAVNLVILALMVIVPLVSS